MKIPALIVAFIFSSLLAGCAASGAPENGRATAARSGTGTGTSLSAKNQQTHPNEPWTVPTVFGTFYRIIPRETVTYSEKHPAGTIVVNTGQRYLYYVLGDGKAIRYNIGVGREGASWSGVSSVSAKREWPDWTPTPGIIARIPNVPRHMEGGPQNPLGARALYLGATMYRIHGTSEPWRIGAAASAGCIRMSNEDVIDLYERTRIGATVIVKR